MYSLVAEGNGSRAAAYYFIFREQCICTLDRRKCYLLNVSLTAELTGGYKPDSYQVAFGSDNVTREISPGANALSICKPLVCRISIGVRHHIDYMGKVERNTSLYGTCRKLCPGVWINSYRDSIAAALLQARA